MTKIPKSINVLYIANILKKSTKWKIQAYENSILRGPADSFSNLCHTLKEIEEMELRMISSLIEFLKTNHKTFCKHPKKMQDTDPNGIIIGSKTQIDSQWTDWIFVPCNQISLRLYCFEQP